MIVILWQDSIIWNKLSAHTRACATATLALLSALLTWITQPIYAAPGTLANTPLFVGTSVEPNVMFLIDDSGSMEFESMTADYANRRRIRK